MVLYGCESWKLTTHLARGIQAFENKCYRRMLAISYKEQKTNDYVCQEVSRTSGAYAVNRRKLSWFSHVCRHDTLPKILQGSVNGRRRRGRPHKSWKDNIKEWTTQSMLSLHKTGVDGRSSQPRRLSGTTTPGRHGF